MTETGPLFTQLEPGRFRASPLTAGPWSPDAQHGAPVAALLLHCLQRVDDAEPLPIARFTVELLRPVPVAELTVDTWIERPGKRVQYLRAEMHHDGRLVAAASAWQIGGDTIDATERRLPPATPQSTGRGIGAPGLVSSGFHRDAVEIDIVAGDFASVGPATGWVRLKTTVVDDEPVSGAQRAAVAADFGNGFARVVNADDVSFINPDLTLYLNRDPIGDWVAIESLTHSGGSGYGFTESVVYDETGVVGRSIQSLLFQLQF